jgi:N-acetylglucosamine-6-sulfatase
VRWRSYIHNIVARNNSISGNCSGPFWREGAEKQNMATYLKAAGYAERQRNTAGCQQRRWRKSPIFLVQHVCRYKTHYSGKYLNTYGTAEDGGVSMVPPGWDDWQGLVGNSIYYGECSRSPSLFTTCPQPAHTHTPFPAC